MQTGVNEWSVRLTRSASTSAVVKRKKRKPQRYAPSRIIPDWTCFIFGDGSCNYYGCWVKNRRRVRSTPDYNNWTAEVIVKSRLPPPEEISRVRTGRSVQRGIERSVAFVSGAKLRCHIGSGIKTFPMILSAWVCFSVFCWFLCSVCVFCLIGLFFCLSHRWGWDRCCVIPFFLYFS